MWNLGCLTCVGHSSHKSSATHSYQCVQYPCVSKQWYSCQCLGFLLCTQMLKNATAHSSCSDTLRQSALEVYSSRKISCCTRDSNPHLYYAWLFRCSTNWAICTPWKSICLYFCFLFFEPDSASSQSHVQCFNHMLHMCLIGRFSAHQKCVYYYFYCLIATFNTHLFPGTAPSPSAAGPAAALTDGKSSCQAVWERWSLGTLFSSFGAGCQTLGIVESISVFLPCRC